MQYVLSASVVRHSDTLHNQPCHELQNDLFAQCITNVGPVMTSSKSFANFATFVASNARFVPFGTASDDVANTPHKRDQ